MAKKDVKVTEVKEEKEVKELVQAQHVVAHLDRDVNDPRNYDKDNSAEEKVDINVPR